MKTHPGGRRLSKDRVTSQLRHPWRQRHSAIWG